MVMIQANIDKTEVKKVFQKFNSFKFGNLKKVPIEFLKYELVYVPFYIFKAIEEEPRESSIHIAVDGLSGSVRPILYENLTNTPNDSAARWTLTEAEAQKNARRHCQSMVLEHGLRFKKRIPVQSVTLISQALYPFWVGYYKKRGKYDFKVIDAVSEKTEGNVIRQLIIRQLRSLT